MTTQLTPQLDYEIYTKLERNEDSENAFDFEVACVTIPTARDARRKLASLRGFAYMPGRIAPDMIMHDGHDLADARSGYAVEGLFLLMQQPEAVAGAASNDTRTTLRGMGGIVFCERLFVHPYVRGNGLGLRMLREIRQVYAASKGLMLLKAFPDDLAEGDVLSPGLSQYYQSDPALGLRPVRSLSRPGWLAGLCKPSPVNEQDQVCLTLKTIGAWEEVRELGLYD